MLLKNMSNKNIHIHLDIVGIPSTFSQQTIKQIEVIQIVVVSTE